MVTSKVAPPHISREKRFGVRRATTSATASMSYVRMRVASSDWWASRKVVSVIRSLFCFATQSRQNFSGPIFVRSCFVPGAISSEG